MNASTQLVRARWIGLQTLVRRESYVILRFGLVTLAPPAILTILYFVIFGKVIGGRIGAQSGVVYINYIAPGLIALWVIPYSYGHTGAGFLGARFFRFIEEVVITPLPYWIVMMGYVIGGVLRGFLVGAMALLTTILFVHLHVYSVPISISALLLAAFVSALGGFITAIFATTFDQINAIQELVLTPLTYLGGVFSSVAMLPPWAQRLSLADPMFYMINAVRYGFLGISDVSVSVAFAVTIAFAGILFTSAVILVSRGIGFKD